MHSEPIEVIVPAEYPSAIKVFKLAEFLTEKRFRIACHDVRASFNMDRQLQGLRFHPTRLLPEESHFFAASGRYELRFHFDHTDLPLAERSRFSAYQLSREYKTYLELVNAVRGFMETGKLILDHFYRGPFYDQDPPGGMHYGMFIIEII
jgi:hypothetical protein